MKALIYLVYFYHLVVWYVPLVCRVQMEQYRESRLREYAFFHRCDQCGIDIPSDYASKVKVLGGHRKYCEATIEGKRQREEAVINDEEFQMTLMDYDDGGGDGSWREEQFATSEHDEGNEATSNRGYDSENGEFIEEENDNGSNHDWGRSNDEDA